MVSEEDKETDERAESKQKHKPLKELSVTNKLTLINNSQEKKKTIRNEK
jgi:hypothetical protein